MEPSPTGTTASIDAGASVLRSLVTRAQRGDTEAFGNLVEPLWPELVALARTVLASTNDAEDVVQDACVNAWKQLDSLRDPAGFSAWLRRGVVRRCWRLARQRRRESPLEDGMDQEVLPRETGLDLPRLMRHLSPRQRSVVYLTAVEGCTDSEIGRELGMTPATVRGHRHLALRKLRRLLAVAVAVLAVAAGWLLAPPSKPPRQEESVETPRAERFLVVTLSSGNRLYIQLSPPSPRSPQS